MVIVGMNENERVHWHDGLMQSFAFWRAESCFVSQIFVAGAARVSEFHHLVSSTL